MIVLPAIDLKDQNCVRLIKGAFDTVHTVAQSPLKAAQDFVDAGAKWLHVVDLDGAKTGTPHHARLIGQIVKECALKVEVGGGVRNMQTIKEYLQNGVQRVILGSAAVQNPAFAKEALQAFGERIAIGIDAKNGFVATSGWVETSGIEYRDLARQMEDWGAKTLIFTDISKDGTLQGPNFAQLSALQKAVSCQIIASGGIHNLDDIAALKQMGLYGAICGKSIYEGTLNLKEALMLAEETTC